MRQRRLLYAMALAGGLVFYWAYREWLAGFLLTLLLALPWISLLLTLPAALLGKLGIQHPQAVTLGSDARITWSLTGFLPPPLPVGTLRVSGSLSGKTKRIAAGKPLPTAHCGTLILGPGLVWCADYLGLVRFPLGRFPRIRIPVRPLPVKPLREPDLSRFYSGALGPKSGGGFSENHELRLYRPGDSLRQIHWKLSAKTGKLILREAMEPVYQRLRLTLDLRGTPEDINRKLGNLLWLGRLLTEKAHPFQITALTGLGILTWQVDSDNALDTAMAELLSAPAAESGTLKGNPTFAGRAYHIGGEPDED